MPTLSGAAVVVVVVGAVVVGTGTGSGPGTGWQAARPTIVKQKRGARHWRNTLRAIPIVPPSMLVGQVLQMKLMQSK